MLFIFMGQSCTGKSTVADELKKLTNSQIYSGKDYLKMAKNEDEAWRIFSDKLKEAASNKEIESEHIIYVITEKENVSRLDNIDGAIKVKFIADIEIIKDRFAQRMKGNLSQPVTKMLERQFIEWQTVNGDLCITSNKEKSIQEIAKEILNFIG